MLWVVTLTRPVTQNTSFLYEPVCLTVLLSACPASPHSHSMQNPATPRCLPAADPLVVAAPQPPGVGAAAAVVGTLTSPAAAASAAVGVSRKIPSNAYNVEYFDRNKQVLTLAFDTCFTRGWGEGIEERLGKEAESRKGEEEERRRKNLKNRKSTHVVDARFLKCSERRI